MEHNHVFVFLLLLILTVQASELSFKGESVIELEDSIIKSEYFELGPNEQVIPELGKDAPNSLGSSSDFLSTPELTKKFVVCDDQRYRPRGPSIHLTPTHTTRKHVSFGWVQFSDDRMMPSEDMLDTPENREHIRVLMLADARHGNLEYFRYLVRVLQRLESNSGIREPVDVEHKLSVHNPDSMIFAAVHSDNVEMLSEVMAFKGISFDDMNPFIPTSPQSNDKFSPNCEVSSAPQLADVSESVLGQAIIHNSIEIVRLLLANGITDEYPEGTDSALHLAIAYGHEVIVRILVVLGNSQIEQKNAVRQTPLMIAIIAGHPRIVKLLLEYEVSLMNHDIEHQNILHYAATVGNMEILIILRDAVRKLNESDRIALISSQDTRRRMPYKCAVNDVVYLFIINLNGIEYDA